MTLVKTLHNHCLDLLGNRVVRVGVLAFAGTDFGKFILLEGMGVLKGLISVSFSLAQCGGLERTDFQQFHILEDLMVLKDL